MNVENSNNIKYFTHEKTKIIRMWSISKRWDGLSFRLKVILTFSTITVTLVGIMSLVSYHFVRNIYLDQLADQVSVVSTMLGLGLNTQYLDLLPQDEQSTLAKTYYQQYLREEGKNLTPSSSFIFNRNFQILVHSDTNGIKSSHESRLQLNRAEIGSIKIGEAITSLPFKSEDGLWYMWGFYRLNDAYWLGIQENAARLAEVEKFAGIFFLIGLSGILLAVSASWLLARSIAKPVEQLVLFSRLLGQGNFSAQTPKTTGRELSILAGAMDKMRSNLARHQQEKEEMLAQIAHEIRNPLGGIELLAGLTKEDLEKNGESSEYIQKIEDEIRGLKSLISAYLNYSRPIPAKPEWITPHETVREVKDMLKSALQKKGIELLCNGTSDPVLFDPNHLRQILMNLIRNSIEALDQNGKIFIETSKMENEFLITVTDNGAGIPSEQQEKIFQPFYTRKDEGTGLGLAICKKLCRENGAGIAVNNNESRGCKFTIKKNI
jgi:signal transduction histidine kinase